MKYITIEANSIVKLEVKEGQEVVIYNLSPEIPFEVISGPNGLVKIDVLARSAIAFVADSILNIRAGALGAFGAYKVLEQPNSEDKPVDRVLTGKSFYLDAGHGGSDPGAINDNFGLRESIAALDVCLYLGDELEKYGATVIYSRISDIYPSLTQRTNQANASNVDAFISIHLNSAESKIASGVETLVYAKGRGVSGELAEIVQENMVSSTGFKNRGVKSRPDLHVLRATKMPAILCEIGFISNDEEAQQLFKKSVQIKIAEAIASGVVKVFGV